MKTRGLLMKEFGVNAILAGRKTQTRRVADAGPADETECVTGPYNGGIWKFHYTETLDPMYTVDLRCPYGVVGDRLYIRERIAIECPYGPAEECDHQHHVVYWAGEHPIVRESVTAKWRPSIHMPKWASRILLRITDVRVERIQDISDDDILAEGICAMGLEWEAFIILWDSIYKKQGYGWDVNPWTWAVTFERR